MWPVKNLLFPTVAYKFFLEDKISKGNVDDRDSSC